MRRARGHGPSPCRFGRLLPHMCCEGRRSACVLWQQWLRPVQRASRLVARLLSVYCLGLLCRQHGRKLYNMFGPSSTSQNSVAPLRFAELNYQLEDDLPRRKQPNAPGDVEKEAAGSSRFLTESGTWCHGLVSQEKSRAALAVLVVISTPSMAKRRGGRLRPWLAFVFRGGP